MDKKQDRARSIKYLNHFIFTLNKYLYTTQMNITLEMYVKKVSKLKLKLKNINLLELYSNENKIKLDYYNLAIDDVEIEGLDSRVDKLLRLNNTLQKELRVKKYNRDRSKSS